eukprot:jgi/Psemu1/58020/gm1.58020_g
MSTSILSSIQGERNVLDDDVEYLFIQSKSERGVNPYWILLDSESSLNLIANLGLVNNIRRALNDGLANVLSLALVSDQYQVTMDTSIDNDIYVHKDGGTRRFQRSSYCSRAKKAQDMQEILGFPTSQELIKMIDNNIINNCLATRRDIKIMTDIYGKHASILKGKNKTSHRSPAVSSKPTETWHYVLTSSHMKHHTLTKTIRAIAGQYSSGGLQVTQIHPDNQFKCIRNSLLDMEYPITTPRRCLIKLVYATVFWMNYRTMGVLPTMSAQELMTGLAYNARTHGKFQFLQYIQAHCKDTNNTMKAQTVNAVYLQPTEQLTEGFYAYHINTGQQIHQRRVTAIPMPQVVIDKLEANALEQGMSTGLKFEIDQPVTILDLDTDDNQDDDDASDQAYVDNPDNEEESLVSVIDEDKTGADSHLVDEQLLSMEDSMDNSIAPCPEELGMDPLPAELLGVDPMPAEPEGVDPNPDAAAG